MISYRFEINNDVTHNIRNYEEIKVVVKKERNAFYLYFEEGLYFKEKFTRSREEEGDLATVLELG